VLDLLGSASSTPFLRGFYFVWIFLSVRGKSDETVKKPDETVKQIFYPERIFLTLAFAALLGVFRKIVFMESSQPRNSVATAGSVGASLLLFRAMQACGRNEVH